MTTAPTGETPMISHGREDDLTAIHGISEERAAKLGGVGVSSLQDLAEVSGDTAESIAATWSGVSASMIEKWRAEAQELLASREVKDPTGKKGESQANPAARSQWQPLAS